MASSAPVVALVRARRGSTLRQVQSQPIRAAAANLKPRRRSSRRPGGFLPAHAEDLLHAGDRFAVLVEHRDLEGRVDLSLGVRLGADLLDALARQLEARLHLAPPGAQELDRRALVPDHVALAQ